VASSVRIPDVAIPVVRNAYGRANGRSGGRHGTVSIHAAGTSPHRGRPGHNHDRMVRALNLSLAEHGRTQGAVSDLDPIRHTGRRKVSRARESGNGLRRRRGAPPLQGAHVPRL